MTEIFKKEYSAESLVDLERDIYEALNSTYNPAIDVIPVDKYGFQEGIFTVTIQWRSS